MSQNILEPDHINAAFEVFGAGLQYLNVVKIRNDKSVRGVHWLPVLFFVMWGWWNVFYYPFLLQWWSTGGAVALVTINSMWLYYIWKYRKA